ncbi:MAG: hypothetical protein RIB86_07960 [Imperialibacter sp.]|uniref:TolB family protein n=1 Tax=Imperialibacter sp. TaxID=2038411 RepID=UPI0032EFE704
MGTNLMLFYGVLKINTKFMNRILIAFALVTLFGFTSCQKEEDLDGKYLYPKALVAFPADNEATINFYTPGFFAGASFIAGSMAIPDSYELFVSKSFSNGYVRESMIFSDRLQSQKIKNLSNGTPYYVTLKTNKKGMQSVMSDTILVMSYELPKLSSVSYTQGQGVLASPDGTEFAFISSQVDGFPSGKPSLFTQNIDTRVVNKVQENVTDFDWSAATADFAFVYDVPGAENEPSQQKIGILNISSGETNYLPVSGGSLSKLKFSPDGKWVAYLNYSELEGTSLWRIQTDGSNKELLFNSFVSTDLNRSDLSIEHIDFTPDVSSIIFSAVLSGNSSIYRISLETTQLESILEEKWNDSNPTISPNGETMIFLSTRSGQRALWKYRFADKQITPLTGENGHLYIWNSKYRWLNNSQLVFSASSSDAFLVSLAID